MAEPDKDYDEKWDCLVPVDAIVATLSLGGLLYMLWHWMNR